MAILAIDTCLDQCAVALRPPNGDIVTMVEPRTTGHAERLPLMVRDMLQKSGMTAKNINKINVTTGPGSFTGVRVGLSFARGMAIGHPLKLHGMTSFQALALSAPSSSSKSSKIVTLIDARRGQIYGQIFTYGATGEAIPDGAAFIENPDQIAQKLAPLRADPSTVWLGSGVALVAPEYSAPTTLPDIGRMAAWAATHRATDAADPTYLRPPDAAPKRPAPSLKQG